MNGHFDLFTGIRATYRIQFNSHGESLAGGARRDLDRSSRSAQSDVVMPHASDLAGMTRAEPEILNIVRRRGL